MARFWPFSRKDHAPRIVEVKSAPLGTSQSLGSFLMFGTETAATAAGAISLYERSSAVAIPVNMIADPLSIFEPVIKYVGSNEVLEDHPILDLLRKPGPDFTTELLLQKMAVDFLVTGESPVAALGNISRPPVELLPLSPQDLTVVEGDGGFVGQWQVSGSTMPGQYVSRIERRTRRFVRDNLTELRVIRRYSTKNGSLLRGQSPLYSAARDARQNIAGGDYNLSLLRDGGRVSLVFSFEDDIGVDEFEDLKQRVRGTYGGPDSEKIVVTSGGKMNVQQLSLSARDMDFEKLQQLTRFSLAQAYHVPIVLMTTDAMTYNNMGEAKLMLYDDAVIPLAKKLLGELGMWLLPRFGEDPTKVRLTFDAEQVEPLIDRRNARLKARSDLNLETRNELRRELPNRPDVEGGDALLVPGTLVPIEALTIDALMSAPEPEPEPVPAAQDQNGAVPRR